MLSDVMFNVVVPTKTVKDDRVNYISSICFIL
jgi:hypothetical protein